MSEKLGANNLNYDHRRRFGSITMSSELNKLGRFLKITKHKGISILIPMGHHNSSLSEFMMIFSNFVGLSNLGQEDPSIMSYRNIPDIEDFTSISKSLFNLDILATCPNSHRTVATEEDIYGSKEHALEQSQTIFNSPEMNKDNRKEYSSHPMVTRSQSRSHKIDNFTEGLITRSQSKTPQDDEDYYIYPAYSSYDSPQKLITGLERYKSAHPDAKSYPPYLQRAIHFHLKYNPRLSTNVGVPTTSVIC
ncbi:unnamed protein product [Cuscuta europaea]|uniref:Uncharacterized protein n=1 Tax=Cuscuta europaea TaxID=41803 RepID=A0A9P0Z0Y0_CUSEU|nr:unnamed protein product [Cuscuta europaea]